MLTNAGCTGRVYLTRDARYSWQSYCIPEAKMNTGMKINNLQDGAEMTALPNGLLVESRVANFKLDQYLIKCNRGWVLRVPSTHMAIPMTM